MSFEHFKNEIKNYKKEELIEKYYSINKEIKKWNQSNSTPWMIAKTATKTHTGEQVISMYLPKLKKQRAIILTKLNQMGVNNPWITN